MRGTGMSLVSRRFYEMIDVSWFGDRSGRSTPLSHQRGCMSYRTDTDLGSCEAARNAILRSRRLVKVRNQISREFPIRPGGDLPRD